MNIRPVVYVLMLFYILLLSPLVIGAVVFAFG